MNQETSIRFALDFQADQHPRKVAVHTDGGSITYGELREKSSRLAAALRQMDLTEQDRILIFMPNCAEYLIVFFAALKLNLDIAPMNALSRTTELLQLIRILRPKLAFTAESAQTELIHSVSKSLPIIRASLDDVSFQKMIHTAETVPAFSENFGKARIFVSTSGSTGKLKFVTNTFQNELMNADLYLQRLCVTNDDVIFTALPVTQKFGMAAMLGSCISGCTLVLPSRFEAASALSLIQKHHVTLQYGVPTMYIKEIEAYTAAASKPDIFSLRSGIIAGAAGSADVFQWFETNASCRLLNCYGTTESGGLTMAEYHDPLQIRYTTCGHAFCGANIEIIDQNGRALPAGEDGEIVCTVPWGMKEYAGEPDLTAEIFDAQQRFLTGDIGRLDEAGNLIISGRKKDMIIRGGYNVFPSEVELALLKVSGVSEACVTGCQDRCLGELICAFVKTQDGFPKNQEAIRSQLAQHIARYKLPDKIIFMDDIPKLANGKFNYPALATLLRNHS